MSDSKIKISVILTVKNAQCFIESCLDSIFNQVFLPIEVVIVDDGSDDNTVKVIESMNNFPVPVNLIKTKGVGRAKALNMAWRCAKGNWISNLDVDDAWHPEKLAMQVDCIQRNPQVAMVITESKIVSGNEHVCWEHLVESGPGPLCVAVVKNYIFSTNPINHSSVLFRKSMLEELNGYNESLKRQIDYDLWIRVFYSGFSVYKVNRRLSAKRVHDNQSFESNNRIRYLTHAMKMNYLGLIRLKAPLIYYFLPIVSFAFGLLPRRARVFMKFIFQGVRKVRT